MTDAEIIILSNQVIMLSALALLTDKPLSGELMQQAERTMKLLEKQDAAMRDKKS